MNYHDMLNEKIEKYLEGQNNPLYSAFLLDSQNKAATTTYFTYFSTMDQAAEAFDRKFRAVLERMPPLAQRSIHAFNAESVVWEEIFQDSRTQLEYRVQSSRILAAAAASKADTIIAGFNNGDDIANEDDSSPGFVPAH